MFNTFSHSILCISCSITNNYETISIGYLQLIHRPHRTTRNYTKLQDCLNELQNWLTNNNLLKHNKTKLLNITNDPNTHFPDIIINQHKIISTNSVKYLGVNFNNKLKGIRGLLNALKIFFFYLRKVLFDIYLIFSETCRANKDL